MTHRNSSPAALRVQAFSAGIGLYSQRPGSTTILRSQTNHRRVGTGITFNSGHSPPTGVLGQSAGNHALLLRMHRLGMENPSFHPRAAQAAKETVQMMGEGIDVWLGSREGKLSQTQKGNHRMNKVLAKGRHSVPAPFLLLGSERSSLSSTHFLSPLVGQTEQMQRDKKLGDSHLCLQTRHRCVRALYWPGSCSMPLKFTFPFATSTSQEVYKHLLRPQHSC